MPKSDKRAPPDDPRVVDDDAGLITIWLDAAGIGEDRLLRAWSYEDDAERRTKTRCAREYVEGWHDAVTFLSALCQKN
jgi:hypothetical protein